MRCRPWVATALFAVAAAAPSTGLAAEPRAPDGTIVQLDGDVAYFDLGEARGVRAGMAIRVLRTVTAKHPVTGDALVDHFPLGMLSVIDVGSVLSYGRVERPLVGVVKVGDVVRLTPLPRASPAPVAGAPPATVAPPAVELGRVWGLTLGKPPSERVRILSEYLRAHPDSPFADGLSREIRSFLSIEGALRAAAHQAEQTTAMVKTSRRVEVRGALPERLYTADPFEIAILVNHPERVAAAFAFLRRPDAITYLRIPLAPDGDGYFRALVPTEMVAPPGLEAFIEVVDDKGVVVSVGDETHPRHVEVDAIPGGPIVAGPGHSSVRGFFELVDFNRFRGNDYYLLTESDFTYRIGEVLWAVRTGFGVLYGKGGPMAELDANDKPGGGGMPCDPKAVPADPTCGHEVGFNYGYLEGELHFGRYFGAAGRLLGGHTVHGPGIGAELRLRIGSETGTNVQIGGSILSDIGAIASVALEWDVIHGWPMSIGFSASNQPTGGGDPGFRFVYQIGYRAKSWLQPALRIGYDARSINHAGLSLGLGLVMAW